MAQRSRIFSSALDSTERFVYGAATAIFVGTFLATMWPIYPLFNRVRPFVLGVPFSLVYLLILTAVCFVTMLALYLWERGRGTLE